MENHTSKLTTERYVLSKLCKNLARKSRIKLGFDIWKEIFNSVTRNSAQNRLQMIKARLGADFPIQMNMINKTPKGEFPKGKFAKRPICDYCKKTFSEPSKLRRHMLIHTGERPHEWIICHKRFSLAPNLKTHMRLHTGEKPYECTHFTWTYACSQSGTLKQHIKQHHNGNESYFYKQKLTKRQRMLERLICSICGAYWNQIEGYQNHVKTKHKDKIKQAKIAQCYMCRQIFDTFILLTNHYKYIHKVGPYERRFYWDICEMNFDKKRILKLHIEWTHNIDLQQWTVCDDIFLSKPSANLHLKLHAELKTENGGPELRPLDILSIPKSQLLQLNREQGNIIDEEWLSNLYP